MTLPGGPASAAVLALGILSAGPPAVTGQVADTTSDTTVAAAARYQTAPVPEGVALAIPGVVSRNGVTVRYQPVDSVFAARVLDAAAGQPPLPAVDPDLPGPVVIFLPRDEATLDALLGGRRPEWSAGLALPDRGWIVLPSGRGEPTGRRDLLGEVLRHELAHIGLHRAVEGLRGPRWFIEGYAQWASGWSAEQAWRLRVALAMDDSLSLEALSLRWPAGRGDAEVAYLLSATVVEFLARGAGERGIRVFIDRWRESGNFEESLRRVFGFTSGQLEESWKEWLTERYGWLYVLTRSGMAWGLLGGLLFVLVWARRRYRKDRMAELRARELPDAPDWWTIELRDPEAAFDPADPSEDRGAGEGSRPATDAGRRHPPLGGDPSDSYRRSVTSGSGDGIAAPDPDHPDSDAEREA